MAGSLAYTTAVKNRDVITFTVDGVEYHFTPGKRAGMTLAVLDSDTTEGANAGVGKALLDWFSDGLPDEESTALRDRLRDPKDEFDGDDLGMLARNMLEAVSGRPFTSRSESSPSPAPTGKSSTPTPSSEDSTLLTLPSTDSSDGSPSSPPTA